MTPLHPGQLNVLRIRGGMAGAAILIVGILLDAVPLRASPVPFGIVTGVAIAAALFLALIFPGRRYRSWAYDLAEEELTLEHGVWTRVRTIVPFNRVQHIDVSQGPVERANGVAKLILHTAGTRNSDVSLPGLAADEAARIRDLIRSRIRQDEA